MFLIFSVWIDVLLMGFLTKEKSVSRELTCDYFSFSFEINSIILLAEDCYYFFGGS